VNQFYPKLGNIGQWEVSIYGWDNGSDNLISHTPSTYLNGQNVENVDEDQWTDNFENIRNVNILFDNLHKVDFEEIKVYAGEAYFFRAWSYFKLLKRYGGVPYITKSLQLDDEELYTPRSSRTELCNDIVADLDKAIENLQSADETEEMRISKQIAQAFKARVCLYEGTWEKYHGKENSAFKGDTDGTTFLEAAVEAADAVIKSGFYSISNSGDEPYYNLFNQSDYSANPEIMLWRKYSRDTHTQNLSSWILEGRELGLTRNAINDYLCMDGRPVSATTLPLDDYSLTTLIVNRDPRLAQTIFYPGVPTNIDDNTSVVNNTYVNPDLTKVRTGFHLRKGGSVKASDLLMNMDQVALIYFRYGEVLLNYIEAKAELADSKSTTLTQNDFDISINKLRDRVGVPHFSYNNVINDTNSPFYGEIPWYLIEIRRERRIELMCEGYRYDDIKRWAAADELIVGKTFAGGNIQWYLDQGIYTPEEITYVDDHGVLSPWKNTSIDLEGGYAFNLGRDYLYPIPLQEVTLAGYDKNPGWN